MGVVQWCAFGVEANTDNITIEVVRFFVILYSIERDREALHKKTGIR